jgi:hypothetical protein
VLLAGELRQPVGGGPPARGSPTRGEDREDTREQEPLEEPGRVLVASGELHPTPERPLGFGGLLLALSLRRLLEQRVLLDRHEVGRGGKQDQLPRIHEGDFDVGAERRPGRCRCPRVVLEFLLGDHEGVARVLERAKGRGALRRVRREALLLGRSRVPG